jgi:hypothetical protein
MVELKMPVDETVDSLAEVAAKVTIPTGHYSASRVLDCPGSQLTARFFWTAEKTVCYDDVEV